MDFVIPDTLVDFTLGVTMQIAWESEIRRHFADSTGVHDTIKALVIHWNKPALSGLFFVWMARLSSLLRSPLSNRRYSPYRMYCCVTQSDNGLARYGCSRR